MNLRMQTNFEEMCLEINVKVSAPTRVQLRIYDEMRPNIVLTDRWKDVNSSDTFFVRMPITARSIIISIFDKAKGNMPKKYEKNIVVTGIEKVPLEKRMDVVDILNSTVRTFVEFAQQFCFNAPYLETGKTYQSANGKMHIEHLDVIRDSHGREVTTPARIAHQTGVIQVAKKYFGPYTVPMRMMILCHEFSHYFVNEDISNESEADLNGLLIYLGLGYPRIEAYQAFIQVFKNAPSEANKRRFDTIDAFIKNFEKDKMIFRT